MVRNQPLLQQSSVTSASPSRLSLRLIYMTIVLIVGILLGAGGLAAYQEFLAAPAVNSFEECVKANGSQQLFIYPGICETRDGKRFTQPTDDGGVNPIYFDPQSCNSDSDCKDGWETYVPGKDYSKQTTCETFVACGPCETPTTPVCRNNLCMFDDGTTPTPIEGYTCPKTEWVDCMPGPLEGKTTGIKLECTLEFLSWAKINCPDFSGAAY